MNKIMKLCVTTATITMFCSSLSALSLADASVKIDEAISNPAKMTEFISQLKDVDQVTFLARVNAAVEKLPGSDVEKVSNFLKVNRAAMKGAAKGNLTKLLAETFATSSPEGLTLINERFAVELFNRAANPLKPISDDAMAKIALETMTAIRERNAKSNHSEVRNTFALLMFIRASNGTPEDLCDRLLEQYPDLAIRAMAKKEWIPPALAEGDAKTYEPLLAACDAGEMPNLQHAMLLAGPESFYALLSSLNVTGSSETANAHAFRVTFHGVPNLMEDDSGLDRVPRTTARGRFLGGYQPTDRLIEDVPGGEGGGGGGGNPPIEPQPYAKQQID